MIEAVTLRRGACFGPCPIYTVTLRRDGTAQWFGERFVSRLGRFTGEVYEADFERLCRVIEEVGFFSWSDRYAEEVTDASEDELEVLTDGESKRVIQYATDEPPEFWVIATLVDGIASGIEWSGGDFPPGAPNGTGP
jgi:hypothetical protein